MIAIAGGEVVQRGRTVSGVTVVIDGERIVEVGLRDVRRSRGLDTIDARGCHVLPGFIDAHVHGVQGHDVLDSGEPVAAVAAALPRYGVTAFCPTSVACGPDVLASFLRRVSSARADGARAAASARVLPAHLESNFISLEFAGAQPLDCLRLPPVPVDADAAGPPGESAGGVFDAAQVLAVVASHARDVGIVTLAPELPHGMALLRRLVAQGHRVSLGHSGADYDTARAAFAAGASQVTHLFNRMPPLSHRAPGLAGAALEHATVVAELILDGVHVHPSVCRTAIRAKGAEQVMAVTDGTAGAGLPVGATARLGRRRIHVRSHAAELDDGTLAGSTATMSRVFANLVRLCGVSVPEASLMCSQTPARHLGLTEQGALEPGALADVVVLGPEFDVRYTIIGGHVAFRG